MGLKVPELGIFGLEFENNGIGSAFAKSPGSAFSECSGPGPGLLYIVCLIKHVCVNLMKLISCCILDSSDLFL